MFDDSDYTYEYEESIDDHLLNDQLQFEQPYEETSSPPVEVAESDNSIAFSTSIKQTREFLFSSLGIPIAALSRSDVSGLIVLRLKDLSIIRDYSSRSRIVPHLIILPDSQFEQNHPDFATAIQSLQ